MEKTECQFALMKNIRLRLSLKYVNDWGGLFVFCFLFFDLALSRIITNYSNFILIDLEIYILFVIFHLKNKIF